MHPGMLNMAKAYERHVELEHALQAIERELGQSKGLPDPDDPALMRLANEAIGRRDMYVAGGQGYVTQLVEGERSAMYSRQLVEFYLLKAMGKALHAIYAALTAWRGEEIPVTRLEKLAEKAEKGFKGVEGGAKAVEKIRSGEGSPVNASFDGLVDVGKGLEPVSPDVVKSIVTAATALKAAKNKLTSAMDTASAIDKGKPTRAVGKLADTLKNLCDQADALNKLGGGKSFAMKRASAALEVPVKIMEAIQAIEDACAAWLEFATARSLKDLNALMVRRYMGNMATPPAAETIDPSRPEAIRQRILAADDAASLSAIVRGIQAEVDRRRRGLETKRRELSSAIADVERLERAVTTECNDLMFAAVGPWGDRRISDSYDAAKRGGSSEVWRERDEVYEICKDYKTRALPGLKSRRVALEARLRTL